MSLSGILFFFVLVFVCFFFFKAALASSSYPHSFISNGRRKHAGFGENDDLFKPYSRISIKFFAELDIRGELILSDPAFKVQRRHQFFGTGKASESYVVTVCCANKIKTNGTFTISICLMISLVSEKKCDLLKKTDCFGNQVFTCLYSQITAG